MTPARIEHAARAAMQTYHVHRGEPPAWERLPEPEKAKWRRMAAELLDETDASMGGGK